MKRLSLVVALALIFGTIIISGCGGDSSGGGGTFKDPYEAYKISRGGWDNPGFAMTEKPPKAIKIKPTVYYRMYYDWVPLSGGEMILEKGKSINYSFQADLSHVSGESHPINANVVIKYDGKADEDLFHADTNTYGNPTIVRDGLYISDHKNHNVKDTIVRFETMNEETSPEFGYNGPEETFFVVRLGVDLAEGESGDGNIGFLYFMLTGVKR